MEESLFDKMQKSGPNLYESKTYAALLKIWTANAYKVSRESGIPRARVYDVLETLTKRGLAMVEESSKNVKIYTPVPSRVFLEKTKKEWENDFGDVIKALSKLEMEADKRDIYVFTVKGKENIISYYRQLVRDARQYVMVSMWNEMYKITELKNFPLFCPECKHETLIEVTNLHITVITEPAAQPMNLWKRIPLFTGFVFYVVLRVENCSMFYLKIVRGNAISFLPGSRKYSCLQNRNKSLYHRR